MDKPIFEHGSRFKVDGTEFEVVTTSTNEDRGFHTYEIMTREHADMRRKQDEDSAAAEAELESTTDREP